MNFSTEHLSFGKLKKSKFGAFVTIKHHEQDFYLKTRKMTTPFGISDYNGNEKYTLRLSHNEHCTKLFQLLSQLDDFIKTEVFKHKDWLKYLGNPTTNTIDMLYHHIIKDPSDYPAFFNVKIGTADYFTTRFFDENKEEIFNDNLKEIIKGKDQVKCVLKLESIWFVGGKFGITFKCREAIVYPNNESFEGGRCLLNFDDSIELVEDVHG